jgi:hypothetical protein
MELKRTARTFRGAGCSGTGEKLKREHQTVKSGASTHPHPFAVYRSPFTPFTL